MNEKRFIVFGKLGENHYEQVSVMLPKERAMEFMERHKTDKFMCSEYSVLEVYELIDKCKVEI